MPVVNSVFTRAFLCVACGVALTCGCVQSALHPEVLKQMFARWQKQQRPNGGIYLVAQLVSAVLVNGSPRQKHIAYLGGIAEDMKDDIEARHAFWSKVKAVFAAKKLKLKPEVQRKIENSLATKVRPVTKAQLRQQQLKNLQQNPTLAQRHVQKIKLEMRSMRSS
jgi:hypothetical protein